MKHVFVPVMGFLFLLASCGWDQSKKQEQIQPIHIEESPDTIALLEEEAEIEEPFQDSIQKKNYSREGIQWKDFHFKPLNNWKQDITLVFTASNGTVDSLTFIGNYDELGYNVSMDDIYEEDINFDGIPDLQIDKGLHDDNCNIYFEGFIWDKENGGFVLIPNYNSIFNPTIYAKEKYIVGTNHSMYAPSEEAPNGIMVWSCDKYQWVDGNLVVTRSWEKALDMENVSSFDFDKWMEKERKK